MQKLEPKKERTIAGTYGISEEIATSESFRRFLNPVKEDETTKDGYLTSMALYIKSLNSRTEAELISHDSIATEDMIIRFIESQQSQGMASSTIRTRLAAIQLYYEMNRKPLAWKLIRKNIPKRMAR